MLRLSGMLQSNYYNIVKVGLLEKGVAFEELVVGRDGTARSRVSGSGDDWRPQLSAAEAQAEFLRKSPARKVPVLETEHGVLTETSVILEYLDEAEGGPPLYPTDPFERARVRELVRHIELYVELPARRLYPAAFFGAARDEGEIAAVRPLLETGFRSVASLVRFDPFAAGAAFTAADLYAGFALRPGVSVAELIWGWDVHPELPGLAEYLARIDRRPAFAQAAADVRDA